MSVISRETLLKKRARRTKTVTISVDHPDRELAGQTIIVRSMTARERSEFESQFSNKAGKPIQSRTAEIRERLVVATVVNEAGELVFSNDDIPALKEVDAAILESVAKASQELNDIGAEDLAELEKN